MFPLIDDVMTSTDHFMGVSCSNHELNSVIK